VTRYCSLRATLLYRLTDARRAAYQTAVVSLLAVLVWQGSMSDATVESEPEVIESTGTVELHRSTDDSAVKTDGERGPWTLSVRSSTVR
jgi:hypothetical protein